MEPVLVPILVLVLVLVPILVLVMALVPIVVLVVHKSWGLVVVDTRSGSLGSVRLLAPMFGRDLQGALQHPHDMSYAL